VPDLGFNGGPWVFSARGAARVALKAIVSGRQSTTNGLIPIRLDNGAMGTLRTEARECLESEDCSPYDCGCTGGELESVWVIVEDARHRTVARMHLWAAYADYQIVPVDLIDGPGDELLIFRIPNHASPPIGFDVKIWKVGRRKAIALNSGERDAQHMPTYPFSCALYRTFFNVDMTVAKPRPIALKTEYGSTGDCGCVEETDRNEIARANDIRFKSALRFDGRSRKYQLR
jgi:hypothetical protein